METTKERVASRRAAHKRKYYQTKTNSKKVKLDEELPPPELGEDESNIKDTRTVEYSTTTPLYLPINNGRLEFECYGNSEYVNLQNMRILMMAQLMKEVTAEDGGGTKLIPIDENENVSVVSGLGFSLFDNVEILLNNEVLGEPFRNHHYIAHLVTHYMSDKKDIKKRYPGALYFPDNAGDNYLVDSQVEGKEGAGIQNRYDVVASTSPFFLEGALFAGPLNTRGFIPKQMNLRVNLEFARAPFIILAPEANTNKYTLVIREASLSVERCTLSDKLDTSIQKSLSDVNTPGYPLKFCAPKLQVFYMMKGESHFNQLVTRDGTVPHHAFVAFVRKQAFDGNFHSSPFEFKNFGFQKMFATVDGKQFPSIPYWIKNTDNTIGSTRALFHKAYVEGGLSKDKANSSPPAWFEDSLVLPINLSTDHNVELNYHRDFGAQLSARRKGNMSLDVEFSKPLEEDICILVMLWEYRQIMISKDGRIASYTEL